MPLPVYPVGDYFYITYLFSSVLPLFSGLRLDTLIIEDAFHGQTVDEYSWGHDVTYDDLQRMIEESKGWKELILRSGSDRWLEAVEFTRQAANGTMATVTPGRSKQPAAWDRMIKERDGPESGAKVEMWCCKTDGVWEKVEGVYNVEVEDDSEDESEDEMEDEAEQDDPDGTIKALLSLECEGLEIGPARPSIEVRVRRGKEAEYTQDGRVAHEHRHDRKLRKLWEELGWKEIKARDLFVPGAEDCPCSYL